MSGGYFDYKQDAIYRIITDLENYIHGEPIDQEDIDNLLLYGVMPPKDVEYIKKHHHDRPNRDGYGKDTLKEFKKAVNILKKALIYTERIDYLLCGDDSEETFQKRLKEELKRKK